LNDKTFVDNYRTPHTTALTVVERFKLVDGGKTLEALIAIEDPGAFNMKWSAVQPGRAARPPDHRIDLRPRIPNNYFNLDLVPIRRRPSRILSVRTASRHNGRK